MAKPNLTSIISKPRSSCCRRSKKVWHSNDQYRRILHRCNNKYSEKGRAASKCSTPALTEDEIKKAFLGAFNSCIINRAEIIENCRLAIETVIDTKKLEVEAEPLTEECTVVAELISRCVDENAHISVDPQIYAKKYESLATRYQTAKDRLDTVNDEIAKRVARKNQIADFLRAIEQREQFITEFDDTLWCMVIDTVTVYSKERLVFRFKGGTEVEWSVN